MLVPPFYSHCTLMNVGVHSLSNNSHVKQFAKETIILSLLYASDCPSVYNKEITTCNCWCDSHNLMLNTNKTKEIIPRNLCVHDTVIVNNSVTEQVSSYKYLGIYIQVDYLCVKVAQRDFAFYT